MTTWSNDDKLCQIFCSYFSNIVSELQIPSISENISNVTDITDPVLAAINMFQDHSSIEKRLDKKVMVNFKICSVTDWTTNNYNTNTTNISWSKANQAVEFGQLIKYQEKYLSSKIMQKMRLGDQW